MNLKRNSNPLTKPTTYKIHVDDQGITQKLANELSNRLPLRENKSIIIVCIGTDRSTGDALGPLVGSKLKQKLAFPFHVYGTLDQPIHAANLEEKLDQIKKKHSNATIIAIDACLGKSDSVGVLSLVDGPVKPGSAVKKQLLPVGDVHITGTVNVSGHMEFFVLQNTRLSIVMKMADVIANTLYLTSADHKLKH